MFKNMGLTTKMILGFGILIVIAGTLGFIGWNSLATVSVKVENADDANWTIKQTYKGRLNEKNFQLRKDKSYREDSDELIVEIHDRVKALTKRLKELEDIELARETERQIDVWMKALNEYVRLEDLKNEAEEKMVKGARGAIEQTEEMRASQKERRLS